MWTKLQRSETGRRGLRRAELIARVGLTYKALNKNIWNEAVQPLREQRAGEWSSKALRWKCAWSAGGAVRRPFWMKDGRRAES